jgi:diguanylate cyclase (GGDEF)-like protein
MQARYIPDGRKLAQLLALLLSIFCVIAPAAAETVKLAPCIAAVEPGDNPEIIASQTDRFDCITPQSGLAPGDYWVKMATPAAVQGNGRDLVFRTASLWDEGIEMWAVHRDGRIAHYRPFVGQNIDPMRLGATVLITLRDDPVPITTLLAKVSQSGAVHGVMLQPSLSSAESAISFEMAVAVLYAVFAGVCIALLVYNIALWRGMREPFLLAYCFMLASTLVYGLFTSGAPHYFLSGLSGADRLRFTTPLLAFTAGTALIFVRFFFENANIPKWLARLTYAQAAFMAGFSTFYAVVAPWQIKTIDAIYVIGFVPAPVIFGLLVWNAWRHKDPFLGYFLVAWSGPALSVSLRMLHGFDILPYHILIENSTLFGLAFEALVSSLAIGYRVRLLALARDRAEIAEAHAMVMADTDPLTGLLNRRAFLRSLLERHSHWTLVLVDIDHFKRVNDSLGHAGGDEAIFLIGTTLQRNSPHGALVARLGGEEFAVAYRGDMLLVDPDDLLSQIRSISLPQGYRITASVGIANRSIASEDDWKILYRAADMALYQAKSGGRDRHVRWQPQSVAA